MLHEPEECFSVLFLFFLHASDLSRASVSASTALLVLLFFIKSFIHSFILSRPILASRLAVGKSVSEMSYFTSIRT